MWVAAVELEAYSMVAVKQWTAVSKKWSVE